MTSQQPSPPSSRRSSFGANMRPIVVVSDCTGESTLHTVKAMLRRAGVGGSASKAAVHLKNYCDSAASVRDAVELAAHIGALVVVGSDGGVCDAAERHCRECGVDYVLEKRALVAHLKKHLGHHALITTTWDEGDGDSMNRDSAEGTAGVAGAMAEESTSAKWRDLPRRRHGALTSQYFAMLDAIDYTITHDDGTNISDLANADLVICGPSRCSKTALCALLMMRGLKCANVPLVSTIPDFSDFYRHLTELSASDGKVVGLTCSPDILQSIRWGGTSRKDDLTQLLKSASQPLDLLNQFDFPN